jgi:hypothetical protein
MSNQYTFRPSALEKTKTLTLLSDSLEIEQEGKEKQAIRFSDIVMVNPKFVGSKNYPNMYQTVLKMEKGKEFVIKNHDYKGILNMEDISAMYSPFILALHMAISKVNNRVVYKKGYPAGLYWLSMIIFWGSIALLSVVSVIMLFAAMFLYAPIALLGLWVLIKQMLKFKRSNKPTIYTVDNVPPNLLPEVK